MRFTHPLGYRDMKVDVQIDPAIHGICLIAGSGAGYVPAIVIRVDWEDGDECPLGYSFRRESNAFWVGRSNAIELAQKLGLPYLE